MLEYKDEIIRQINNKKVLRAHWKKKTIQESYNGECLKEVERLVETIKAADFKKKKKQKEIDELQMKILSSRRLLDGEVKVLLDYLAENAQQVEMSVDNIDDWAYDKNFVGKFPTYKISMLVFFVFSNIMSLLYSFYRFSNIVTTLISMKFMGCLQNKLL